MGSLRAVESYAATHGLNWLPEAAGAILGGLLGVALAWPVNRALAIFFGIFNAGFRAVTRGYVRGVGQLCRVSFPRPAGYGGLLYMTYYGAKFRVPMAPRVASALHLPAPPYDVAIPGFSTTPKGFIPSQDMGYLLVNVQLPDSSSLERTDQVMAEIEKLGRDVPGVKFTQAVTGQSLLLSAFGPNFGSMFIILDEFSNRREPVEAPDFDKPGKTRKYNLYGPEIAKELGARFAKRVPEATITVLPPPPGPRRRSRRRIQADGRGPG